MSEEPIYHYCSGSNRYKPWSVFVCSGCRRASESFDIVMSEMLMNERNAELKHQEAYTFVRYDKAKQFLTEYSKRLEGYKIYAIDHWVRTETNYSVYDCDVYKENQKGIRVNGVIQPTGKFDKDCNRI